MTMMPPDYKPCKCERPHLTREHLFARISRTPDGQGTFSMKNPYYNPKVERRGRPKKCPPVSKIVTPSVSKCSSVTLVNHHGSSHQSSRWTPKICSTVIQQQQQTIGDRSSNGTRVIRKPLENQTTTINPHSNGPFVSIFKSTPTAASSPVVKSKYDIWHSIKSTFQDYRRLCKNDSTMDTSTIRTSNYPPQKPNKVIHQSVRDKSDQYNRNLLEENNWIPPLERIPFRPPPGSINGVTVFSMKNPFANKSKVNYPIDELTRLYYETIDTIEPESSKHPMESESTTTIDHLITSSNFPLTPISPTSPMSTTSLPTEDHFTPTPPSSETISFNEPTIEKEIKVKIEGGDAVVFKEISDFNCNRNTSDNNSPITTTIFDDICITDFNEFEFDQMISNLPDLV